MYGKAYILSPRLPSPDSAFDPRNARHSAACRIEQASSCDERRRDRQARHPRYTHVLVPQVWVTDAKHRPLFLHPSIERFMASLFDLLLLFIFSFFYLKILTDDGSPSLGLYVIRYSYHFVPSLLLSLIVSLSCSSSA